MNLKKMMLASWVLFVTGLVMIAADPGSAAAAAVVAPVAVVAAKTNWVLLLIPVVVPMVIALVKVFLPKLPKVYLPILAPLLGALIDFLAGGDFGAGTILGAVAGSAGVGLREILDQAKKLKDAQ